MIQKLNRRKCTRHYFKKQPSVHQWNELAKVQKLLASRRGRSRAKTFDLLRENGYTPVWHRVRWIGGVGSYQVMRGGIIRVSVAATRSGVGDAFAYDEPIGLGVSRTIIEPPKRRGYRYGWCIEIPHS